VGRIESRVWVSVSFQQNTYRVLSYDVLRQQKTGLMTKRVVSGGEGVDLRLRRITSSPSQTLRRCLMRTTATDAAVSAWLDAVHRGFIFTLCDSYGLQHCRPVCSVCSDIRSESRFCLPHPHSTPPLGGFPSECRDPIWHGKTRMAWLPDSEKISKIFLFVLTQLTNVIDGQTHRQTDIA